MVSSFQNDRSYSTLIRAWIGKIHHEPKKNRRIKHFSAFAVTFIASKSNFRYFAANYEPMKKTVLLFFFVSLTLMTFAQRPTVGFGGDECGPGVSGHAANSHTNVTNNYASLAHEQPTEAAYVLYPNPTVSFFAIDEESLADGKVSLVNVYNLVGQRVRSFSVEKEQRFNIADLQEGLYLVQLLDSKGKPIVTRRLHKMPGIRP